MLEIMPYEYWANLAERTYLNSPANLILVELSEYGDGTLYMINSGIHEYLEDIIEHHRWIFQDHKNPSRSIINLFLQHFSVHPRYIPSVPFMLKEMELLASWLPYPTAEDFMSQSIWMFDEYENNTVVEDFMSQSNWIFEEHEEVEDIMSEANWMFEESEVSNTDDNSKGLEPEDIMSEANWMFEE